MTKVYSGIATSVNLEDGKLHNKKSNIHPKNKMRSDEENDGLEWMLFWLWFFTGNKTPHQIMFSTTIAILMVCFTKCRTLFVPFVGIYTILNTIYLLVSHTKIFQ